MLFFMKFEYEINDNLTYITDNILSDNTLRCGLNVILLIKEINYSTG